MDGRDVIERLRALPGGPELLALGAQREDLALVGGAVRDVLIEATPRELDVVVDDRSAELAAELARSFAGAQTTIHERFGTAAVAWPGGEIDIAERRAESYAHPGALPDVRRGGAEEDLARRDFTVNAIAVPLGGPHAGELQAVENALEDLAARRLRVLHGASFVDDPTRILRLCRYRARLRFQIEEETARLAADALAAGALDTVSGGRVATELLLAAHERTLPALGELGALAALGLPAHFDSVLLEEASEVLPADGDAQTLAIAVLFHPTQPAPAGAREQAARRMDEFEFHAQMRERVLAAAFDAPALAHAIEHAQRPSQLHAALAAAPVEAVAIAAALGARRSPEIRRRAQRWLQELRGVELEIRGEDLIDAGVAEGPEIGRRLQRALDLRLDGELTGGRDAELAAALGDA
jgi:tRNA nucleotidyltransferase (CCA-adding enzyme)